MPLGIVNDSDFNRELVKLGIINDEPNGQVIDIVRGRGAAREIPVSIREIIAEEAINKAGTGSEIARTFGVSPSSVSAYKHGATSTASYNSPDNDLQDHTNRIKEKITGRARSRLMMALKEITPDKLVSAKVRDLAGIAKDMSAVVKNMEPNGPLIDNSTKVVVYRPHMREESEFEVITVNE